MTKTETPRPFLSQPAAFTITGWCSKISLAILLVAWFVALMGGESASWLPIIVSGLVMAVGIVVNLKWNVSDEEE